MAMATIEAIKDFGIEELCDFLSSYELSEGAVNNFRTNRINGALFFDLDTVELKELLPLLGDRKLVQKIQLSYQPKVSVSIQYNSVILIISIIMFLAAHSPSATSRACPAGSTCRLSVDHYVYPRYFLQKNS